MDPLKRYGVGVLFSGSSMQGATLVQDARASGEDNADLTWVTGLATATEKPVGPIVEVRGKASHNDSDSDDFDLSDANTFKPSAMAISFKCRIPASGRLRITVTGAYYDKISTHIEGVSRTLNWWVRRPFTVAGVADAESLIEETNRLVELPMASPDSDDLLRIQPSVNVYSRPVPGEDDLALRLVTVAVVNRAPGKGAQSALFQMGFEVRGEGEATIEPYPEGEHSSHDDEEQSIDLLYRKMRTFAIGHGCAADWKAVSLDRASWVRGDPMPVHEVTSLTPNVYATRADGTRFAVTVSMDELANDTAQARDQIDLVLSLYEKWINEQDEQIPTLAEGLKSAARRHIRACRVALARMDIGRQLIRTNPVAARAFQLANEAMLYQQLRSRLGVRAIEFRKNGTYEVNGVQPLVEPITGKGQWRPFQIAFILASLPELVDPSLPERDLVDLIFFPTGGGKTEAYLGASAISLIARRLRNPNDVGTDTLMRYTLRLLTAQQFLRAASLICVLEDIRLRNPAELGEGKFGIGIWLGGGSTPNNWSQAVEALGQLRTNQLALNKFLLLRCPWCGTQMGTKPKAGGGQNVCGYEQVGKKVLFICPDSRCRFGTRRNPLPIHVVDEDIYASRPSIVIGTVDKFAMMAWRPEARFIFGLGPDGSREVSPPGLIIQDELHLISGPLGSMVGLYEAIVDELCTDRRAEIPVVPKIVASTATIRRYKEQILGIFGRDRVSLFPPHGLEQGRSFFAEPATLDDGSPEPGRRYLGVHSASLGSMQTVQVRVTAALLQGGSAVPEADRDGYWTNLMFLNSLRELGNTVSLLEADVPDYLTGLRRREQLDSPRWPRTNMELTSRRRSDEIPKAIEQLQIAYGEPDCVDICLASNIIEVGIDIDRLALMTIVGQPKTTAQYIQVSGRVGRKPEVSPGLVVTIYGAAKPRDRSHFERFRTYHQSLYAQVEPTSVTAFATPVLRRAMHAAVISHMRLTSPNTGPYPFPRAEFDEAMKLLETRASLVDSAELGALAKIRAAKAAEWDRWERTEWSANAFDGDPKQGLMRFAGTLPDLDSKATIWDVPTSMRNVDAECRLKISMAYSREDAGEESVE
ncbi:helicase-related protein [Herbiconiux sp. VKM Ac-1786]|uniref:helicase-related protein n=1 Tax=Herbiconiux sp. VKM Ac-1786 TaxID=2783824 RepID=UPI00351C9942